MTTPEPFPTGFKCETCGKFHEFGKYVAAHWRTILKHKCDRCDAEHTVICGSAKLRKRGVIPTCGTCSLWRIDDAKDKAAERAEVLQDRAAQVVAPVIDRTPPKIEAIKTREVWRFEITDPAAIPREYLLVDETKLRKVVGAMKGDTRIPGVRVYAEKQLAAGAA